MCRRLAGIFHKAPYLETGEVAGECIFGNPRGNHSPDKSTNLTVFSKERVSMFCKVARKFCYGIFFTNNDEDMMMFPLYL